MPIHLDYLCMATPFIGMIRLACLQFLLNFAAYAETVYATGGRIKWNLDDCLEGVPLNRYSALVSAEVGGWHLAPS